MLALDRVEALVRAVDGRAVHHVDVTVYVLIARLLSDAAWRPVKLIELTHALPALSAPTVSRSLLRLAAAGFLYRGPREGKTGPFTYRLPLPEPPSLAKGHS